MFRNAIAIRYVAAAAFALSAAPRYLHAQATQPAGHQPITLSEAPATLPDELKGISIDEHLDQQLPLDLELTDEQGKPVKLGDYFDGKRPVILTLVYFGCPMLCGLVSNAQMEAMKQIENWSPGEQYQAITVSFDPRETSELAQLKKQNYINALGRPNAAQGWHFLTGKQDPIHRLTRTAGFNYRWDERQQQFAHAAAIMIVTPDGRLSRYLYGVTFDPKVLRLSLVEASQGKIGSTMDHVLLYCFQYDPDRRAYTLAAQNVMMGAALLTVVGMSAWLVPVWVRGARSRRSTDSDTGAG